ncbi:MAG: complex I NDUFA9 subunit family protein [Firmicutes bacterium]|nr:complex I NDUFA9 subunit family protein [Bacillota bacterium]
MNVVVTGASGFVGRRVVAELVEAGHHVKGIQRQLPADADPRVVWIRGDLADLDLVKVLAGAEAVVHLVGIIREDSAHHITFERIHVGLTERVLRAAQIAEVPRLIHMSALGTRRDAVSQYHHTKWRAEELVRSAPGLAWTILRPSLIFGSGAPFFDLLATLSRLPRVPVPGDGRTLFQPVSRTDVARLIARALPDPAASRMTLEIGGPERFSLNQLFDLMGTRVGRPHPPKVHLPLSMVALVASFHQVLPVPITPDQLAMLTEPNVTDDTTWLKWVPQPEQLSSWAAKEHADRSG